VDAVRVCDLPDQARLPDARLADDGDDLAVTRRRARERLVQCLEFGLPPDYINWVSPRAVAACSRDRCGPVPTIS
jgi:hypothetical protein